MSRLQRRFQRLEDRSNFQDCGDTRSRTNLRAEQQTPPALRISMSMPAQPLRKQGKERKSAINTTHDGADMKPGPTTMRRSQSIDNIAFKKAPSLRRSSSGLLQNQLTASYVRPTVHASHPGQTRQQLGMIPEIPPTYITVPIYVNPLPPHLRMNPAPPPTTASEPPPEMFRGSSLAPQNTEGKKSRSEVSQRPRASQRQQEPQKSNAKTRNKSPLGPAAGELQSPEQSLKDTKPAGSATPNQKPSRVPTPPPTFFSHPAAAAWSKDHRPRPPSYFDNAIAGKTNYNYY